MLNISLGVIAVWGGGAGRRGGAIGNDLPPGCIWLFILIHLLLPDAEQTIRVTQKTYQFIKNYKP